MKVAHQSGWVVVALLGFASVVSAQVDLAMARQYAVPDHGGSGPIRAVDLDGDGRDELIAITGSTFAADLVVYSVDPRGAIYESQRFPSVGAFALFARDFDDVPGADVIAVSSRRFAIFPNDGTGLLGAPTWSETTEPSVTVKGAAVGDFDSDGIPDVVLNEADRFDGVSRSWFRTFVGDGVGGFTGPIISTVLGEGGFVVGGDFDEDGFRDVVVADSSPNFPILTLFLGDGTGAFGDSLEIHSEIGVGNRSNSLVSRDFDGDFHADFAFTWSGSATTGSWLHIFLGNGDGTFRAQAPWPIRTGDRVAAEDLDADGDHDMLLTTPGDTTAIVLLNDGSAGFADSPESRFTSMSSTFAVSDFTSDGTLDLAQVGPPATVCVFEGEPGARFPSPVSLGKVSAMNGRNDFHLVDVDSDGHYDIARKGESGIDWVRGDGAGGFVPGGDIMALDIPYYEFTPGDFDGDGVPDFAVNSGPGSKLHVYRGDGTGAFSHTMERSLYDGGFRYYLDPLAADLDEDGRDDLIAAIGRGVPAVEDGRIAVLLAIGGGDFGPTSELIAGHTPRSVAAGDFDEDGHLDVIVGKYAFSSAFVYRGDGAGSLGLYTSIDAERPIIQARVFDADEDGRLDVALVSDANDGGVFLALGNGNGSFAAPERILDAGGANNVVAADFDGDGRVELLASTEESRALVVLEQDGVGGFVEAVRFHHALDIDQIAAGDLDGDSLPDVVIGSENAENVFVVRNRSLDPVRSRRGNVNAGVGPVADVLLCNGSAGQRPEREIELAPDDPFELEMLAPPSKLGGPSKYVLYIWAGRVPTTATVRRLPFGIGVSCLPTPLAALGDPAPRFTWNNIGRFPLLGAADFPSSPAPSVIASRPSGLGREITFTCQGVILDTGAPNGQAAVTNAIVVKGRY